MGEEFQPELDVGLSEEEREDLETLIKTFRHELPVIASDANVEELQQQVQEMTAYIARLSEMVLKFDTRMKSYYEIIRLFYQKSEKMNERINVIIKYLKSKENL